jgi:predicted dehydrogenase
LNLGVHDIDLAALLGGVPVMLRRAEGNDARAMLTLQTAHGALVRVRVDRDAAVRRRSITLTTPDEIYEGDLLEPRLRVAKRGGGPMCDIPLDRTEPLAAQATAVHAALVGRPDPSPRVATASDGAAALEIAERAMRLIGGTSEAVRAPLQRAGALAEKL